MTLTDLFHFLVGKAEAIRLLATDPWTLTIGAPLVLSAGLARHLPSEDATATHWKGSTDARM